MNKPPAVVWRLDHSLHTYGIAFGTNSVVVAGQKRAAAGQTAAKRVTNKELRATKRSVENDNSDHLYTDGPRHVRTAWRVVVLNSFGHTDNGSLHGLDFGPDGLLYGTLGSPDGELRSTALSGCSLVDVPESWATALGRATKRTR